MTNNRDIALPVHGAPRRGGATLKGRSTTSRDVVSPRGITYHTTNSVYTTSASMTINRNQTMISTSGPWPRTRWRSTNERSTTSRDVAGITGPVSMRCSSLRGTQLRSPATCRPVPNERKPGDDGGGGGGGGRGELFWCRPACESSR